MDPTLAALIGAGIGSLGTITAPIITSRRSHKAHRRETMREAYAEGIRLVAEINRAADEAELEGLKRDIFASQVSINLVGSARARQKYHALASLEVSLI